MQNNFTQSYNSTNNINKAFSNNKEVIGKPDFTNRGNMMHNNMGDSLKDKIITEYKLHINSKDRDTTTYPSPFHFKLQFGSTQSFSINKKFTQVKYITIDNLILPKNVAIDVSRVSESIICPAGSEFTTNVLNSINPLTKLTANKYIVLKINELDNIKTMSTSSELNGNSFIFYRDKCMGIDSDLWRPIHGTVVFYTSYLFTLSNMTISLYDFMDNPIKIVDHENNDIIKYNITGLNQNYINYIDNTDSVSSTYTNNIIQMNILMSVGVIENELTINNY
jgi:hypothetical protein